MMTDRELEIWDPFGLRPLQRFSEFPDTAGKYTALGGKKGQIFVAYNPNPGNKKQSRTMLHLFKEISFDRQINHVLEQGDIDFAYKLFNIEYRGS